ncbi:MAG: hypothetical protein ACT4P4_20585, partial [Betaproteobacteria bacterium]
ERGERGPRQGPQGPADARHGAYDPVREAEIQREEGRRMAEAALREEQQQAAQRAAASAPIPVVEQVEAPRVEVRPAPPPPPPQPKVDPRETLADSGLVMVETDRSKAPVMQAEAELSEPRGRPRRDRKPPRQDAGELQQVETKR